MRDNLWCGTAYDLDGLRVKETVAYYSEGGLCKPGIAYLSGGHYYAGNGEPIDPTGETETVAGWQINGEFPVYTTGGDHPDAYVTVVPAQ